MAAILEKLPQILNMNVPTGTKRVHALRELGLTKEEVACMIVTDMKRDVLTLGHLRVHEDVLSDIEPEDKKRRITSRQKNSIRDSLRSEQPASRPTPRPRPIIRFRGSDKNGPAMQGHKTKALGGFL